MVEYIQIADVKRPVSFSLRIAYIYEVKFGRPYLRDVMKLSAALQQVSSGSDEDSIFALPIPLCADIFWAAFANGAKQVGEVFNHEPDEIVDWFLSDANVVSSLMEMFMMSFPSERDVEAPASASQGGDNAKNRRRRNGRK